MVSHRSLPRHAQRRPSSTDVTKNDERGRGSLVSTQPVAPARSWPSKWAAFRCGVKVCGHRSTSTSTSHTDATLAVESRLPTRKLPTSNSPHPVGVGAPHHQYSSGLGLETPNPVLAAESCVLEPRWNRGATGGTRRIGAA